MTTTHHHYTYRVAAVLLRRLRLEIITLLGSLGGSINGDLISGGDEDMSHAIVWDTHDKLLFALPFQDMKPTRFFGE